MVLYHPWSKSTMVYRVSMPLMINSGFTSYLLRYGKMNIVYTSITWVPYIFRGQTHASLQNYLEIRHLIRCYYCYFLTELRKSLSGFHASLTNSASVLSTHAGFLGLLSLVYGSLLFQQMFKISLMFPLVCLFFLIFFISDAYWGPCQTSASLDKIVGTKYIKQAKLDKSRNFWYLLLHYFWALLRKLGFSNISEFPKIINLSFWTAFEATLT